MRQRKAKRDIEKAYPATMFVAKLRRLADCIEAGRRFRIMVGGERISVPPDATINIEHERGASNEEIEFQVQWRLVPAVRGRQPSRQRPIDYRSRSSSSTRPK